MKPSTIEITWDGHVVVHWEGILDAEGWAEIQRRFDLFKEGDTKTIDDCKSKFNNVLNWGDGFRCHDWTDHPCGYPLDKL